MIHSYVLPAIAFLIAAVFHFQFLYYVCPRPFTRKRRVFLAVFTALNALCSVFFELRTPYVTAVLILLVISYCEVVALHGGAIGHAQTLYSASVFLFVRLCTHGIVIPVLAFVLNLNMRGIVYNEPHFLLSSSLSFAAAVVFMLFFTQMHTRRETDVLFRYPRQGWLVTITLCLLLVYLLMETYVYRLSYETYLSLAFHLLTSGLALAGFYLIFVYAVRMSSFVDYQIETRYMELQLKRQLQHYEQYTQYVTELREFRHDYHRMKDGVRHLLESGDVEQALALLGQMEQQESRMTPGAAYSNNVIVDAILRECAVACQRNDIAFSAQVTVPPQTGLDDLDFCRIFGNLVDNAVEACRRMEHGPRFIEIKSNSSGNWLTVEFLNSYSGQITMVGGFPKSSKHDPGRHGLGLRSVRRLVEDTGGFLHIQASPTGTFSVRLHLSLPPQARSAGEPQQESAVRDKFSAF